MARIVTSFDRMYFTSALPDIVVSSSNESATVSIVDFDHHILVVQMTVFMYYNRATLRNIRKIIEAYMESNDKCFAYLTFNVVDDDGAAEDDLFIIYNKYAIDSTPEDFLASNFLSTARSKVIYPNVKEHLSWYVFSTQYAYDTFHVDITVKDGDTIKHGADSDIADIEQGTNIATFSFTLEDIESMTRLKGEVVYFTITAGNRQMRYYVSRQKPSLSFYFFNAFNILETVSLQGVTKTKTDVSRNVAHCSGKLSFYDTDIEKVFETETAPLSSLSAIWLEQLIFSRRVMLIYEPIKDKRQDILISKSDYTFTDSDEEPNTIKFTWRFANETIFFAQTLEELRLKTTRTFTSPFDQTFK